MLTEAYFGVGKALTKLLQLSLENYLGNGYWYIVVIRDKIDRINYKDKSPSTLKEYQDLE